MTDFSDSRVIVPDHILVQGVEDESVLLNLDSEHYFGLDAVGTRMWEVLTTSASIQEALDALQAEYDVNPDVLQRDLRELVEQLVEHGLLELARG